MTKRRMLVKREIWTVVDYDDSDIMKSKRVADEIIMPKDFVYFGTSHIPLDNPNRPPHKDYQHLADLFDKIKNPNNS